MQKRVTRAPPAPRYAPSVEVNRGGPGNPQSHEELARKFHDNAERALRKELAARTLALLTLRASRISPRCWTSAGER
jgi:hypothetical protein